MSFFWWFDKKTKAYPGFDPNLDFIFMEFNLDSMKINVSLILVLVDLYTILRPTYIIHSKFNVLVATSISIHIFSFTLHTYNSPVQSDESFHLVSQLHCWVSSSHVPWILQWSLFSHSKPTRMKNWHYFFSKLR